MVNLRQRMFRRAVKARKYESRVYCRVMGRVPCTLGGDAGHMLTIDTAEDGRILHVRSECTMAPPSADEVALVSALTQEVYRSCAATVTQIHDALQVGAHYDFTWSLPEALHKVFVRGLEANKVVSRSRIDARNQRGKHLSDPRQQGRVLLNARLNRKLVLPDGFLLRFGIDRRGDRTELDGGTVEVWLGPEHRDYRIATYKGHGFFLLHPNSVAALGRVPGPNTVYDGKKSCLACNTRVRNFTAHTNSKRHEKNVEAMVGRVLEQIADHLLPTKREQR